MKSILRIFSFTKSLWKYYLLISIFTIFLALMNQIQPLLTKGAIDQITNGLKGGKVDVYLVGLFAVGIFITDFAQTLFSNIGGYFGDVTSIKVRRLMSQRYYEHLLSLPQTYFDQELSGRIINRMNRGIDQISDFMQMYSNNFLQFIFSTILSLAIVAYFSWPVALMLFLLYPVFIVFTIKSSRRWLNYQKTINEELDISMGRFAESIGQVKVVKSFIQEARELKFFKSHFQKVVDTTYPQSRYWHRQDIFRRSVLNLIFLAVFVFIFVATAEGHYSIGTMVLLIQYAMLIRIPIFTISFLVDQTQRAIANTNDYFEIMDIKPNIVDHPKAKKLKVDKGEIIFKDVDFSYGEKRVLNSINFSIKPSSKIALVGESGEGKTTITNLLMRLYEPSKGKILIDGQDILGVSQGSLRENIAVVFQDPAIFSGTIRENISYSKSNATNREIIAAAKAANAHEFISKLKDGYESEIGERGLKLSGGEKQRVSIARALLKDAPILILDEATSNLDSKSETSIQQALKRLMKGRTTLIIAHRLSTIEEVDQIITLRNGRVDEIGSPTKLARSGGIYDQLLKMQGSHSEKQQKQLKQYDIATS